MNALIVTCLLSFGVVSAFPVDWKSPNNEEGGLQQKLSENVHVSRSTFTANGENMFAQVAEPLPPIRTQHTQAPINGINGQVPNTNFPEVQHGEFGIGQGVVTVRNLNNQGTPSTDADKTQPTSWKIGEGAFPTKLQ